MDDIKTMSCPILSNSKPFELTVHTSTYGGLRLTLCYQTPIQPLPTCRHRHYMILLLGHKGSENKVNGDYLVGFVLVFLLFLKSQGEWNRSVPWNLLWTGLVRTCNIYNLNWHQSIQEKVWIINNSFLLLFLFFLNPFCSLSTWLFWLL